MKPGSKAEQAFLELYGDGKFHRGNIGGVDRQMRDGIMNEYQGIGDYGMDLGGRWGTGRQQVPKFVGFTASDVYKVGGPEMKDVYWEQMPNLWNMYQSPYNAERWGDYLPGSDEERGRLQERANFRGHERGELAREVSDRVRRNAWYARNRHKRRR
jgi:hypothetical protein